MANVIGKVYKLDDIINGSTADGKDWSKQTVVVAPMGDQTSSSNPRLLAIEFFGTEKVEKTKTLKEGDVVEISYSVRSEEYGSKWYTRLDGIKLTSYAKA